MMRVLKVLFMLVVGGALVFVQLFESRPAPCMSAECVGFNVMWLAILLFGLYVLWRAFKLMTARAVQPTPAPLPPG
jgi:hypothetical protein